MNGRRVRDLLFGSGPGLRDSRELHRVLGELVHTCAAEWKDAAPGRKLDDLKDLLDVTHSDLYLVFRGQKRLDGRLFLAPPQMLLALARELSVYARLVSGELVEADIRSGNSQLVIALADLQAHDSRASADASLTPDECRRGLELCDAAQSEIDRRRRLYEHGLGERGVRDERTST